MLFKILKLLAIPCALSVVLPFLDTYRIAALPAQEQTGYLLLALGAMLGFGAAGYLISWGLSRLDSNLTIQRRRVYDGFFSAVFLAGLEFFLPWNGFISGLGNLLLGATAVLSFLIAGHAYFQEYGEVFNRKILYRNLKIQVSCMVFFFVLRPILVFSNGWRLSLDYTASLVAMGIVFFLYLFIGNQNGIDFLMRRGQYKMANLPPKIRRYNLRLMSIVAVLLGAVLFLREPLLRLLRIVEEYAYRAFRKLIQFLFSHDSNQGTDFYEPEVQANNSGIGFLDRGSNQLGWLWNTIAILIVLFFLYYFRREILSWLEKVLHTISRWMKTRRKGTRQMSRRRKLEENEYYSDDETFLESSVEDSLSSGEPLSIRRWKRDYRRYLRMSPGESRLISGYRLILRWLLLKGAKLTDSQTANEIFQHNHVNYRFEDFEAVTKDYNQAQYQGRYSDEQQRHFDHALRELASRI